MNLKRTRFALVFMLLTGCAGLIGVPDLTLEEDGTDGGPAGEGGSSGSLADGQAKTDGSSQTDARADGSTIDAPIDSGADADGGPDSSFDAATCDLSKIATDKNNCGECGHVCLDNGECHSGMCDAVTVTTIADSNLSYIVEHGDYLYVSSPSNFFPDDAAGIWRVHKTTGDKVQLLNTWRVDDLVVLDNKLYFITADDPFAMSGGFVDDWGGIWECDLATTTPPCTPRLLQEIEDAVGLTAGNSKIYFSEEGNDAIRSYTPALDQSANGGMDAGMDAASAFATVGTHSNIPETWRLFADGAELYFLLAIDAHPQLGKLNAQANGFTMVSKYDNAATVPGMLRGNGTDLVFSMTDFDLDGTTGGLVRRVSRTSGSTCDYAGGPVANGTASIARPRGIYLDDKRVYWANRGPYDKSNASIASCDLDGCCTQAKIHWNQAGDPKAIVGDAKYLYWAEAATGRIMKVGK